MPRVHRFLAIVERFSDYTAEPAELEAAAHELFDALLSGALRPPAPRCLPLAQAAEAHRLLTTSVNGAAPRRATRLTIRFMDPDRDRTLARVPWPPALRAILWLDGVLLVAAGLALGGKPPALGHGADLWTWLALAGSTLTAVLAALSAFQLSLPSGNLRARVRDRRGARNRRGRRKLESARACDAPLSASESKKARPLSRSGFFI